MATALELKREGWHPYLEAARRHLPSSEVFPSLPHDYEQLLARIREAAALIKIHLGAQRVILFGSLAHAAWFHPDSDVDLAVEGLRGDAYWQAWRLVEEIIRDYPVDLIEIETAGDSLRRAIHRHGVDL